MKKILICLLASIAIITNAQETTDVLNYVIDYEDESAAMVTIPDLDNPQVKYKGNIIIPAQIEVNGKTYLVKGIDSFAFYVCEAKVSLPPTIEHIDAMALVGVQLDEEVYLPNLRIVGPMAMIECTGVKRMKIGATLNRVGEGAFCVLYADEFEIESGCKDAYLWVSNAAFTRVVKGEFRLPDNCVLDLGDSFGGGMDRMVFPNISEIDYSPSNCWSEFTKIHQISSCLLFGVKELVCLAAKPPKINIPQKFLDGGYYNQPSTTLSITNNLNECILKVPAGSEELYKNDPLWGMFKNIQGFAGDDYTSVTDLETKPNLARAYYSLQGIEVKSPVRGQLYILRINNQTMKIVY